MELLAPHKAIKKPPRSDEGDGELFCGTLGSLVSLYERARTWGEATTQTFLFSDMFSNPSNYKVILVCSMHSTTYSRDNWIGNNCEYLGKITMSLKENGATYPIYEDVHVFTNISNNSSFTVEASGWIDRWWKIYGIN